MTIVGQANVLLRASARRFPVHRFHFRRFLGRTKFAVPSSDISGFLRLTLPCRFLRSLFLGRSRPRNSQMFFHHSRRKKIWGDAAETDGQTDRQRDKTASGKKWDWTRFASRQFSSWCDAGILDSNLASRKSKPPWGALPSKKLGAPLRSLANCTFLWLLLVAQPPSRRRNALAKSLLAPASRSLANAAVGCSMAAPFCFTRHPSVRLSRDGSRRKWYCPHTCLPGKTVS